MPQNPDSLSGAPISTPLFSADGLVSQQWALWFQKLVYRVGGGSSTPLSQISSDVAALQTHVATAETNITALQTGVADLNTRELADRADINTLQTTVGADSGTWAPTLIGAAETGAVNYAGWWKSIGEELFWEVEIDATVGTVTFTAAQITNMPQPTTRPGAFAAVNTSAYADYGNGMVAGNTAYLPNFTLTSAKAIFSGRYVK
ncbi:hypothetical protein AB4Y89_21620 [Terriglobus sp. 2YAB30_2]|uniref:hypothetical protein n=1 Tax=unclassified Terriglobus TaxID=2628988 RepID=UPI003F9ACEC7